MDSARWIVDFLTSPATPAWGAFLIIAVFAWRASVQGFPAIILAFVERRRATAAEKAADWDRLRAEVSRLADAEADCHVRLNDALRRLAELEGYMMGQGKARQEAAGIVALDRIEQRVEKDKPQ